MQQPPKKRKEAQQKIFNPRNYETSELSLKQVYQMKEAFDFFDKDHSGSLQINEIKEAMQILGFISDNEDDLNNLIQLMDEDGDKNLDFNEFMEIISENIAKNDKEKDFKIVYQYFLDLGNEKSLVDDDEEDDDFSRIKESTNKKSFKKTQAGNSEIKITIQMLRSIAKQIGETIEDEDLLEMIDKADKDEDGEIGFKDFQQIIQWENPEKKTTFSQFKNLRKRSQAKNNDYLFKKELQFQII